LWPFPDPQQQSPADLLPDTEHLEKVRRDEQPAKPFAALPARQIDSTPAVTRDDRARSIRRFGARLAVGMSSAV
jgi:hypothetical protein